MRRAHSYSQSRAHSPTFPSLHLHHKSFSNPSVASPTSQLILQLFLALPMSQLILQSFSRFSYITASAHSPTFLSLHLHHSSFSNPFVTLLTSQLILQPFHCFTYITAHSPTLKLLSSAHSPTFLSLHLQHSSFSNSSITLPTSQLILQPFHCFTYITAHSPTLKLMSSAHSPTFLLHLHHSSFSNPSVASPTSQLILRPFCRFTYVTAHTPTLLSLDLRHTSSSITYVTSPTSHLIL